MIAKVFIPINDRVLIVDMADYVQIKQYNWRLDRTHKKNYCYAVANISRKPIKLHRLLLNPTKEQHIDHINGDGLDNTRKNLRIASQTQNMWNLRPRKKSYSKYKGVTFMKVSGKWRSRITANKKPIFLGTWVTEEEAAKAYNEAAKKYFGEFAHLNVLIDAMSN